MWTKQTLTLLGAAAVLGFAASAGAQTPAGKAGMDDQNETGRYHGFAEGNPELPYDGDGEPGINPEPAQNPSRTVEETRVYPDTVDRKQLGVDVPKQAPPYSDKADVHGAFGEGNPDVQR